ncbi:hypothetical protein AGABI1DRAFT_84990 [Agaricus bisporus var. burnettii JB137-S8]|uniref:EXPERA domain-containing protein n=1 Tax=Agaricus bisporus var. burnettii (strain JB137-S8 / ATCC MYA-4627 / FGSC 10392) TaxID=597362 RepID=K5WUJ8_AGABU|nr:uncharacterized protein AGABI1DRAFT_84990 [Agaricus bisporus var. burnettii JB137-S8]EKM79091.1 hypothetical protein AGABI1DRAFT_84990 [Agaricus bisporus var. burnettii JB137-S8]
MDQVFTTTSLYALLGVSAIAGIAKLASDTLLPKDASKTDRWTFVWLIFDGLIHFSYEGSWLYFSTFGRQVNTSAGPLAAMWREYSAADFRWGVADPNIVSLEILTVLGAGPLCLYIAYQIMKNDPARHYWIIVMSTAELYGGFMTFCPDWLIGSPNLNTSNWLHLWVYLIFMNTIWVVIPLILMVDSYGHVASALRGAGKKIKFT